MDDLRKAFEDEMSGYLYSRGINPTVDILRRKLAALDGAEDCLVFNRGRGHFCRHPGPGQIRDHIVSVKAPYTWAQRMFDVILPRFGINTTYIDGGDLSNWEKSHPGQYQLLLPRIAQQLGFLPSRDVRAVATLARQRGIITMIDNSYCSPLYQRPIEMGIDLAMQTATKYISGHSDTLGAC